MEEIQNIEKLQISIKEGKNMHECLYVVLGRNIKTVAVETSKLANYKDFFEVIVYILSTICQPK